MREICQGYCKIISWSSSWFPSVMALNISRMPRPTRLLCRNLEETMRASL